MLLFATSLACGQGDPDTSTEQETVSEAETPSYTADPVVNEASEAPGEAGLLPASEGGQRLGVDHWVISDRRLEGYSGSGNLVAQFFLDADAGVLESVLPETGFKMLDDSENALTETSRAYLDALTSDLARVATLAQEARENVAATEPGSEIGTVGMALTVGCFTDALACQLTGVLGQIDGRWRSFTCESRALFGCRAPFPIALVI